MKQPVQFFQWKPFFVMLFLSLFSLAIWGQEEGSGGESSSTTTTTKSTKISITSDSNAGNTWYTSPWVWIVGAAAFILLLVALLSNRGRDTVHTSDTVRVSKTVEKDSGNRA